MVHSDYRIMFNVSLCWWFFMYSITSFFMSLYFVILSTFIIVIILTHVYNCDVLFNFIIFIISSYSSLTKILSFSLIQHFCMLIIHKFNVSIHCHYCQHCHHFSILIICLISNSYNIFYRFSFFTFISFSLVIHFIMCISCIISIILACASFNHYHKFNQVFIFNI